MTTFEEHGLRKELLKAVTELGFVNPTPIQEKTIPAMLESKEDLIALAQTGTGKTAGFGLPIIQQIDPNQKQVQAIILSPTRELCIQIAKDIDTYSKYMKGISVLAVYGGAPVETQLKALRKGVNIVVGTPGRTLDLIKRRALKIDSIQWLVLDEADEMLNMGFRDELDGILETTPETKQTLLFSATMPKEVRNIANNYMNKPREISVGKKNMGADNVTHQYYVVKAPDRYLALKRLADINPNIYGIVFCRTRHETKDVAAKLMNDGYNADAIHGDLSQAQRDSVMQRFRKKQLQLLVATDVAARGLDIADLTHILNYNLPDDPEVYIHRSGRTGRAGKHGISISITHGREGRRVNELEKLVGKKFEHAMLPSGKEICEKRLYNLMDKIEKVEVDEDQIEPFMPAINKKLSWLDRDDLLKRFVTVEFQRFLKYYKNAKDLNITADKGGDFKGQRRSANGFTRFFINLGSKQRLRVPQLIGLINDETNTQDIEIGKIEILRNFSFFEVDSQFEKLIMDSFKNSRHAGVKLAVQIAKPPSDGDRPPRRSNRRGDSFRSHRKSDGKKRSDRGDRGGDRRRRRND